MHLFETKLALFCLLFMTWLYFNDDKPSRHIISALETLRLVVLFGNRLNIGLFRYKICRRLLEYMFAAVKLSQLTLKVKTENLLNLGTIFDNYVIYIDIEILV